MLGGVDTIGPEPKNLQVECDDHGSGFATYVCEHLVSKPAQLWYLREIDAEHKWLHAWCTICDAFFQEQDEWNEKTNRQSESRSYVTIWKAWLELLHDAADWG